MKSGLPNTNWGRGPGPENFNTGLRTFKSYVNPPFVSPELAIRET